MILLGMDLETTHFDQDILRVTEMGAVLYDTKYGCPIDVQADLVYESDINAHLPMSQEVVNLTGITDSMLLEYGKRSDVVLRRFFDMYKRADYVVAHNGNAFDKPVLQRWVQRTFGDADNFLSKTGINDQHGQLHWLDTMLDIPYPDKINIRKLEDLCGRHGFLNPFPHRAFTDVMAMMKILGNYDINQVIEISHSPTLTFQSLVDYHNRHVAKQAGFKWIDKKWVKSIKKYFIDEQDYAAGTMWDFSYKELL